MQKQTYLSEGINVINIIMGVLVCQIIFYIRIIYFAPINKAQNKILN